MNQYRDIKTLSCHQFGTCGIRQHGRRARGDRLGSELRAMGAGARQRGKEVTRTGILRPERDSPHRGGARPVQLGRNQ
ncbi:Uncharacterised protein [Mycobacteroides abscessus subsp. abscessus]|nr:Uncharacterised protein [Mycobacteroides abscessus subsp. abscessus]